jgi:hypothetical protein|tara:strand:+ start:148 stop:363 length:216 start_codon:yes stop_codon:yes gene_type:complete
MITKIILRFENLDQEQEHKALDWLANCEEKKEMPFKLFLHKGGINNKMVEITPQAGDPGEGSNIKKFGVRT